MGKVEPIEAVIDRAIVEIAEKYGVDAELVKAVLEEFDAMVSPRLMPTGFNLLISSN